MKTIAKKKPKKLSWYKDRAWKLFSEFVRRKHCNADGYGRCYTCGVHAHWKQLQCGHAIPSRSNAVLLDEEICRPQCVFCNIYKHGNLHLFATKLMMEVGEEWWLNKLGGSKETVKVNRAEYEDIIAELQCKLESL